LAGGAGAHRGRKSVPRLSVIRYRLSVIYYKLLVIYHGLAVIITLLWAFLGGRGDGDGRFLRGGLYAG